VARDDRMSRVWSPGSNVGPSTLVNGAYSEIGLAPSIALLAAQDRILREWTVTRIIGQYQFESAGASTVFYGIRVANENETPGSIDPGVEQTADWMLWGGLYVAAGSSVEPSETVMVDNRSQRKSRGMESVLVLYTFNAGPDTVDFWWTGRTLLLVP